MRENGRHFIELFNLWFQGIRYLNDQNISFSCHLNYEIEKGDQNKLLCFHIKEGGGGGVFFLTGWSLHRIGFRFIAIGTKKRKWCVKMWFSGWGKQLYKVSCYTSGEKKKMMKGRKKEKKERKEVLCLCSVLVFDALWFSRLFVLWLSTASTLHASTPATKHTWEKGLLFTKMLECEDSTWTTMCRQCC